ncbi:hypothetical protein [Novosphingobium sp. 9]|uniref:hypothetical protein n=1 Tax=Novosphingobium sp. 9 TaxID=2025349 RepID=UPI0021B511E7|nr:hypothetical protein [Novosphingobium sp. 9]
MHTFKTTILAAAAFAVAATPALAAAPAKKAAAKPAAHAPAASLPQPPASEAEVKNAMLYLKVLISGLESKNVDQPAKGALVGCLYNNSLGKITHSMDEVIRQNPEKIHRENMSELLSAMVMICGYNPAEAKSGAAPGGPSAPSGAAVGPTDKDGAASASSGR